MTEQPAPPASEARPDTAAERRPVGGRVWAARAALFVVPVLLGLSVFVVLGVLNAGPERAEIAETARAVRAIRAESGEVAPRYAALGVVRSPTSWDAVAQVSGDIVYRSPNAAEGRFVDEGEVLFRIDREEYEIAVRQVEAARSETESRLANLDAQLASTEKLIEIERESLQILEANDRRVRESLARGAASPGEVDDARREYLSQLARVTDLESIVSGYPSDRAALEATLAANSADLENAQLALRRTELAAPFTGRVTEVVADVAEFVGVGQSLLTVADISTAEVVVNCSPLELRRVFTPPDRSDASVGLRAIRAALRERVLAATVRLPMTEPDVSWEGSVERVGASLDPSTRTLPIYVTVEDPYGQARPGTRPPLIEEMFCEVELRAEPVAGLSLIPRTAYHDGLVHLVVEDRLALRPVSVAFRVGDYLAVSGLEAASTVLVSDLPFAIEGMLLEPSIDEPLQDLIRATARGEERLR